MLQKQVLAVRKSDNGAKEPLEWFLNTESKLLREHFYIHFRKSNSLQI